MGKSTTVLEQAIDLVASTQEFQERLPRRTLLFYTVAGVAAALKEVTAQLEAEQPKRKAA